MTGPITEKFSKNLKTLRNQKGITQDDIARIINTSRSCISNYESGNREPDNETILIIADYFNVSVDFLLGRSAVRTLFKDEDTLCRVQEILSSLESVNFLDISKSSTYVKCTIVEFYNYLLKKEAKDYGVLP